MTYSVYQITGTEDGLSSLSCKQSKAWDERQHVIMKEAENKAACLYVYFRDNDTESASTLQELRLQVDTILSNIHQKL